MKTLKLCLALLAVVVFGTLVGCSTTSTKTADVSDSIRTSLDRAGFKDVSVSQDRDKGVVTLGYHHIHWIARRSATATAVQFTTALIQLSCGSIETDCPITAPLSANNRRCGTHARPTSS